MNERELQSPNGSVISRRAADTRCWGSPFSWLVAHKFVASVIAGPTKPEQVEQNVKAAGWMLTPEDLAEIDRVSAI